LYEGGEPNGRPVMSWSRAGIPPDATAAGATEVLRFGGGPWLLVVGTPERGSPYLESWWIPLVVLLATAATGALTVALVSWGRHTRRVERLVAERTAELAEAKVRVEEDNRRRRAVEEELRQTSHLLEKRVAERTQDLLAAYEELETLGYSAWHDLRGALRTVASFSDLLVDDHGDALQADGRDALRRIRAATDRMEAIVDAMAAVSASGRAALALEPVDLAALTREVAARLAAEAPDRGVELVVGEGAPAIGDPNLLRTVIWHLLSNAWKFTLPVAAPRVEVSFEARDGEVVCCVRDNGVGFDAQRAESIFEPFRRLHRPDELAGIGLGLALARRIVARHGGRVWARSRPGEGARIFFSLPAARP
jgi:signal transduction histidine kinase